MGFINTCNNPLNPEMHASYATCIWKWNESGFRPPLCTYRLNWARRTSWGWWNDWDDTVLQTQDSKFEPWRSEAEHATSRSRRLPTILTTCIWKPDKLNPLHPLLLGGNFEDNNFLDNLLFICSISACLHSKYWAGKNNGSSNICTPWIISGKFYFLEDMLWLFFQLQVCVPWNKH